MLRILALLFVPIWMQAIELPSNLRHLPAARGLYQGRLVHYQEYQGWALVEGDILLAPLSEILPPGTATKTQPGRASSVTNESFRLWPDGVVAYVLDPTLPEPQRVLDAMKHWEERTPVRFVERTTHTEYVTIRPAMSGCSANVGRYGSVGVVNLSTACDTPAVIHELGHTLGLYHHQSRIDRDRYVRVRYDNIDPYYWSQYDQQFLNGVDHGPYDFVSIMHYSSWGFSRAGAATLQSFPAGIPIGSGDGLTALDRAAVSALYGKPLAKTILSSTPSGLTVLVDGQPYVTPAEFEWADGEAHTVSVAPEPQLLPAEAGTRYRFALWSDGEAGAHSITTGPKHRVFDARFRREFHFPSSETVKISPASEDGFYVDGSLLTVEPVAPEGQSFLSWTQPDADGENQYDEFAYGLSPSPLFLTLDRAQPPLQPLFAAGPVTTVEAPYPGLWFFDNDDLHITPARFAWKPGSLHSLEAWFFNNADYYTWDDFVAWPGSQDSQLNLVAGEESKTILAQADRYFALTLAYDWWLYSSDTKPNLVGYTLSPDTYDGYYLPGTTVTITPPTSDTWRHVNWYGDASGSGPLTVTLDRPLYITGNFFGATNLDKGAIVNDATRQPGPVAPGQRLRIHWVGGDPVEPVLADPAQPLPTALGGLSVAFDGVAAPLLSASNSEVVCLVPDSVAQSSTTYVVVRRGRGGTLNVQVPVVTRSPGLYLESGVTQGLLQSASLRPGDPLELRATGLTAAEPLTLVIDEQTVEAVAAPAASNEPGIWRVQATVPASVRPGRRSVYLLNGGRASQIGVVLDVVAPPPPEPDPAAPASARRR